MDVFVVIDPSSKEKLRRGVAKSVRLSRPLYVVARERLDELTTRRRPAQEKKFLLELSSIHLGDGGFLIAKLKDSDSMARIDCNANEITLSIVHSDESTVTTP